MAITSLQLAQAVELALAQESIKEKEVVKSLLQFTEEKGLQILLPNVLKHLEKRQARRDRRYQLQVSVARKQNAKVIDMVKNYIKAPKDVRVEMTEDESLEGGFVAQYDNVIYDGSVKSQLKKVKEVLTKSN